MRSLITCLALVLLAGSALAQTKDEREPPKSPPPPLPLPPTEGEGSGSSMSERLSETQGVIKPPQDVDPGIKRPTPPTGPNSMPVIPPPGTPGGDQSVQPK
jgi:hypothetical protein